MVNSPRRSIATKNEQRLQAAGYGGIKATAARGKSEQRDKEGLKGFGRSHKVHTKLIDELTLKTDQLIGKAATIFFSTTRTAALGHKMA